MAVRQGDEEAARAALERKNQQEETANSLQAQVQP
jgi:phage shock protein A